MRSVNVYYWLGVPNFGDALNIPISKELFGIDIMKSTPQECEATFLGSTLDDFLFKGG